MAKILMKQSKPGSMDGMTINLYKKGIEYEIDDNEINQSLADAFIEARWAVLVRTRIVPVPSEPKEEVVPSEPKEEVVPSETKEEKKEKAEPKNTRVYEVAGELDVAWQDIVALAKALDIDVSKAQSGLTDTEVKKIKEGFAK